MGHVFKELLALKEAHMLKYNTNYQWSVTRQWQHTW